MRPETKRNRKNSKDGSLVVDDHVSKGQVSPPNIASQNRDGKRDSLESDEHANRTPSKKQKVTKDWEGHSLNVQNAIVEPHQSKFLSEIAESDLSVLKGISGKALEALHQMRLKTVRDLGGKSTRPMSKCVWCCKFFKLFLLRFALKNTNSTKWRKP